MRPLPCYPEPVTTELVAAAPEQPQSLPATQGVSIPNLRSIKPTFLVFLADWQRDHSESDAALAHRISVYSIAAYERESLPFARACVALRNGQRLAGLDTEIIESEFPHLVLDALRESRDTEARGADRLGNRRLLAELGKRIGSGAAAVQELKLTIVSLSAVSVILDGDGPGAAPVIDATATRLP